MKNYVLNFLLLTIATYSYGQRLPYVGADQSFVFPNITNQFINSANICWALDAEVSHSFACARKVGKENIFNLLVREAISGGLEAYSFFDKDFEKFENLDFSEFDKFQSQQHLTIDQINYILSDSLKIINFHQIFYLDSFKLKCKILSAAPSVEMSSSHGFSLGLKKLFVCCKETIHKSNSTEARADLILLMKTKRIFSPDSLENSKVIKQTYGLNLVQSIWHGASEGLIKLTDIKSNRILAAVDVMNYSIDSVKVPVDDTVGNIGDKMKGSAVFPYQLINSVEFTEAFFYNYRAKIFISIISDCYLVMKNWDPKHYSFTLERKFKLL